MRRFIKGDRKYLHWGITAFVVIAFSILFYMALAYLPSLGKALSALVSILAPFIWGLVISYILLPMMHAMENHAFIPLSRKLYAKNKKNDGSGLARGMSVLAAEIIFLVILAALVWLIIPQLYNSIETMVKNSGEYMDKAENWVLNIFNNNPTVEAYALQAIDSIEDGALSWLQTKLLPQFGNVISNVYAGVYSVFRVLYNLIIGIIVSVYIMARSDAFTAGCRKLLYCIFTIEAAEKIRYAVREIDRTFMTFISSNLYDAAIVGVLCYIFCVIVKMPYALLVSAIVGITNMIPFFGPLIGAVPSGLIILFVSPIKCLIFIIFIVVLQQFDGNLIKPKILGSSLGIGGFWVMFAIILGGGLFGFWGMLLGVPVFTVIYTWINNSVNKKLKRSALPTDMEEYKDLDRIDPVTREPVKRREEGED